MLTQELAALTRVMKMWNWTSSHINDSGSLTSGGILRDQNGIFMKGFYCKVSSSSSIYAEAWAKKGIRSPKIDGEENKLQKLPKNDCGFVMRIV
ncbi:hypothetical protein L195_g028952 [Trifolium pratense]|uniref:Uncharacterized protein n=1 Tax=Trifolium pratense TaxID=57577 RepID=A0A2K3L3F7_TRIPR|nr:hypothetical protein L195_g028952 [Trifolium pratense]